jgi:hypothetical protein
MSDNLSKVFNVAPTPVVNLPETTNVDGDIHEDAKIVRTNLKNLILTSNIALENALNLAIQSELPRAYDTLTGLITAMGDLNNKLLATHQLEQKAAVNKTDTVNTQNNVTNNNVIFTGTPAELAKLLQQQKIHHEQTEHI